MASSWPGCGRPRSRRPDPGRQAPDSPAPAPCRHVARRTSCPQNRRAHRAAGRLHGADDAARRFQASSGNIRRAPWWRQQPQQWVYPLQTVVCLGLLAFWWRQYSFRPIGASHGLWGIAGGVDRHRHVDLPAWWHTRTGQTIGGSASSTGPAQASIPIFRPGSGAWWSSVVGPVPAHDGGGRLRRGTILARVPVAPLRRRRGPVGRPARWE